MASISKEKQIALEFVDENRQWLSDFHKEIWGYAEPAFREYRSAKAYVKLLREEGFEVEEGSGVIVTPLDAGEPKSGRFAGVLIGSLGLDTIAQDFVSPIVSGQTGYAWLLNEEGVFLAHYEQEFVGRSALAVRAESIPEISYTAISFYLAGVSGVGVGPGG